MKKKIQIAGLVFIILFHSVCSYGSPKQGDGNFPTRIISLKPNITELLFTIGAGSQVVGVTTWCNRPKAAAGLPKVADYIKPNIEMIMALKPDLVISSKENSVKNPINVLQKSDIPIRLLPFTTVDNLLDSIIKLGEVTGHSKEAIELASSIKTGLPAGESGQLEVGTKPQIILVVGKRPLVAAGPETFLGELVEIAGGRNIISGKIPYPHVDMETIIAKNPDVIIDLTMGSEKPSEKITSGWNDYPTINAVINKRIYNLDISDFRAGPDILKQVKRLGEIIQK